MKKCPKCGASLSGSATECVQCGVVISKYLQAKRKAEAKQREEEERRKAEAKAQEERVKKFVENANKLNGAESVESATSHAESWPKQRPEITQIGRPPRIRLDCAACKSKESMAATEIPRFPRLIRLIGYIIALPSFIGAAFGLLVVANSITDVVQYNTRSLSGAAAASSLNPGTIGFFVGLAIAAGALVAGLIGWLLIMKRKVYHCIVCGYFIERA